MSSEAIGDVFGVLEVDTSSPYVRVMDNGVLIAPPLVEDAGEPHDATGWVEIGFICDDE